MTRSTIAALREQLTGRDQDLLLDVERLRLLSSRQLQRLHFDGTYPTAVASARACNRALTRLRSLGLLKALERRIGGVRAGSAGAVWYIGPAGERLLRSVSREGRRTRRNYREPSRHFVVHTLAVSELAVQAIEAQRCGHIDTLEVQTEPASWQQSLSRFGTAQTLKPDLRLVTASGDYEHHWFLEADLASEHQPVIARQSLAYQDFRSTGRYQAEHGLFPAVVWVVPEEARRSQLRRWIDNDERLDEALFTVITVAEFGSLLRHGSIDPGDPPTNAARQDPL